MVVVGVGAVMGLVIYDAGTHDNLSGSTTTVTTNSTSTGTGDLATQDPTSSGIGAPTLNQTQSAPQATSGGS